MVAIKKIDIKIKDLKNSVLFYRVTIIIVFILHFLYFAAFNRYHLAYQEQIQLFRLSRDYFVEFLSKPGGIAEYAGLFLIQFYLNSFVGALIITLIGFITFLLFRQIFKKLNITGILWQLIPVFMIAVLQSDYVYYTGYTIGFLLAVAFFLFYISLHNKYIRFISASAGVVLLYIIAGEFAILTAILIILYELLHLKAKEAIIFVFLFIFICALAHYLLFRFLWLLPRNYVWIKPVLIFGKATTKYGLLILLVYLPLMMAVSGIWVNLLNKPLLKINTVWGILTINLLIIIFFSFLLIKYVYDYRTELLLGIDNKIQKSEWDKALLFSSRAPGNNQIVIFLTNIALYNAGRLGNEMFHYNQIGTAGLFLGWGNETSPFFGNELFYQLGYINEAYRWAFEAMVASGPSPRILKKLSLTSIINGDYEIAEKYLHKLEQTIFYRKWARYYLKCINDSELLNADSEIRKKRHFLVYSDFFANVNNYEFVLIRLLENHPDNRMAFEYLMSYFLLKKDLESLAANIYRIKETGIKEIPVHYEEALLVYMAITKANIVPEGYTIRETTRKMFDDYITAFSTYTGNPDKLQQYFYRRFGKTYLFYLQFGY